MKLVANKKKYLPFVILVIIFMYHFIHNALWLHLDEELQSTGSDTTYHLLNAFQFHVSFHNTLQVEHSFFEILKQLFRSFIKRVPHGAWPPFVYLVATLFNNSFFSIFATRFYVNILFYFLLIIGTYLFGKKWFNQNVGLIAAFIISFYPSIYGYSREYGLDLPLVALFSICLMLLIHADYFSNKIYSVLFGISLGIATLIKLPICFFIAFPLVYVLWHIVHTKTLTMKVQIIHFFISISMAAIIFYVYWGGHIKEIITGYGKEIFYYYRPENVNRYTLGSPGIPVFSQEGVIFYFLHWIKNTTFPLFILFSIALITLSEKRKDDRLFFLGGILTPYIIFTLISAKLGRYILPLLTYSALITAWWINQLKSRMLKSIILICIIVYCLVVHFSTSWKKPYRFFADNYFSWLTRKGAYPVPPNTERYKQPEQIIGNKDLNALVASIKDVLIKDESVEVLFIDSNSNGYFDLRLCLYLYTHFHDAFINNRITYHTLIDEHWIDSLNADTVDYLIVNRDDWVASNDKYSQFRPLSHKEGPYLIMQKRSL